MAKRKVLTIKKDVPTTLE